MKLNEPRAARKRGSVGWRRQIACVAKEAYGSMPPPPTPKRTSEEQGGGCLIKQGPRCRGRGEAARDCVFTAEPSRTVAVDRTVAGLLPH